MCILTFAVSYGPVNSSVRARTLNCEVFSFSESFLSFDNLD